jgi:uncharacterized protein YkwD
VNRDLAVVAARQLHSMVRLGYFADQGPAGQTPLSVLSATRYPAHAARYSIGEDIAWAAGADATPAHILAMWLADPPHRAIILSPAYRDAGVASSPCVPPVLGLGPPSALYAVEFGARGH